MSKTVIIFLISMFCFALLNFSSFSQTTNQKKDYITIDSLTKDLKTYSYKLITKDTSVHFLSGYESELETTFKFLKKKKLVRKNPDVTFNVFIDNIFLQYPSFSIEPQSSSNPNVRFTQSRYKMSVNYNLSMGLQIVTKYGSEYFITLIPN